jgi:type IV pilus assembly protein PilW
MSKQSLRLSSPVRQQGVTLIEIMLAMVLGLLVVAGLLQLFVGSKVSYNLQEGLGRLQEDGRLAMELVAADIRMAGQNGCRRDLAIIDNSGVGAFLADITVPIEGFDAVGTGLGATYAITATDPAPSASASDWLPNLNGNLLGDVVPGSDAVVVRYMGTREFPLTAVSSDTVYTALGHTFPNGTSPILMAADCQQASIFQPSAVNDTTGTITHAAWTSPEGMNDNHIRIGRVVTVAYFICQSAGGGPALCRSQLQASNGSWGAVEELVEGVENMQILYGRDTTGDGGVDDFVAANAVGAGNWGAVVSVRLSLLVRTVDEVSRDTDTQTYDLASTLAAQRTRINPVDDNRLRKVFSSTLSLRNRLP